MLIFRFTEDTRKGIKIMEVVNMMTVEKKKYFGGAYSVIRIIEKVEDDCPIEGVEYSQSYYLKKTGYGNLYDLYTVFYFPGLEDDDRFYPTNSELDLYIGLAISNHFWVD